MINDGAGETFGLRLSRGARSLEAETGAMPGFDASGASLRRIGRSKAQVRPGAYRDGGKRAFDLVVVLCAALPVAFVVLVISLALMLSGQRPFYAQTRLGRQGRPFRMWKIRTMLPDAEEALAAHLDADPEARAEWQHSQKLRHDPRITPLGHFLRRSSLDELPQLFNVLRGEMALVGPRPMLPEQSAYYPGEEYYQMRPGLTGFWQTSERNAASFAQRAEYDRSYYRALSFATDLRVMLRTLLVVARGTGL
ncbi:sugar transferase [Limimaricola pyoseonensis]|nr:sugar transferase [Limimaricola pyoseonensis]